MYRNAVALIYSFGCLAGYCDADELGFIRAEIRHGPGNVIISCQVKDTRWIIGQELSFVTQVENHSESDVNVFDPFYDLMTKTSQHTTQLEILDHKFRRIGDMFAWDGGAEVVLWPEFWHVLPNGALLQSRLCCYHAGYVPRTEFIKGHELAPGVYYLRLVIMGNFFWEDYKADSSNKKRIAESKPIRIELITPTPGLAPS